MVSATSMAQDEPPRIDATKYCEAVSAMFAANADFAATARENCQKSEHEYGAKLARVWSRVPLEDRKSWLRFPGVPAAIKSRARGMHQLGYGEALS